MPRRAGLGLWILCALWLFPLRAWADPAAIAIGGVTIQVPLPPGWCVYPDDTLQKVLQAYKSVDQTNEPHVFYGVCEQVDANTRELTRIRDFGYLGTPRDYLDRDVGEPAGFLDEMARTLKSQDLNPEASSMRDKLNKARLGLQVGSMRSLGLVGRDENAVYSGFLTTAKTATEKFQQLGVMGVTAVKGRLLFCYTYADYENEDTLNALLARTQAQVARLRAENP